jgi:hypothetical protein
MAVSVVIYMIAIAFGLALFVVPIYLMSRPTVVENAGLPAAQSVDRALAARSSRERFPVAHIKQQTIVDPDTIAELNAKVKEHDVDRRRGRRIYARPRPSRSYTDRARPSRPSYPNFSARY